MATAVEHMDAERRFYGRMAIAIFVVTFIGFAPSFYLFQTVSFPRPNPPLTAMTMTHGLVFTAWLAIFYAQTRLIAAGADVNAVVLADETALINASAQGDLAMLQLLLSHGALINLQVETPLSDGPQMRSALSRAANDQIRQFLRAQGAR